MDHISSYIPYIYYAIIFCIFFTISYVDYKEHAIYDKHILIATIIIFAYNWYSQCLLDSLLNAGAGLVIGLIIFFTSYKYYGFEAFGLGDVFLLAVLGLFLGNDFRSYIAIAYILSGFLITLLIPFMGYDKVNSIEIPMAPILLVWVPIFIFLGKPSIIHLLQKFFN